MKKIVALLFAIVMALSVCACEKTPAAVEEPRQLPRRMQKRPLQSLLQRDRTSTS